MALYVIAIGGDFMHARMLLPATFALLLPVMLVPVPVPRLSGGLTTAALCLLVATIGVWASGAALKWRDPVPSGVIPASGIAAERGYWVVYTHQQHPDNAAEFVLAGLGSANATGSLEWLITQDARSGQPELVYYPGTTPWYVAVPLNRPAYSVALAFSLLGQGGAGTPLNGLVVDQRGLSYALGSHLVGDPNGRPGHTKWAIPTWIVAQYSDVTQAPGYPRRSSRPRARPCPAASWPSSTRPPKPR